MQTSSGACKVRVVQRLMGPRAVSANRLAATVGMSQEPLSRWLRHARSVEGMTAPKKRTPRWTGADKLRVVLAAEGLADEALGALLRQEGLHAAQLAEWRASWPCAGTGATRGARASRDRAAASLEL